MADLSRNYVSEARSALVIFEAVFIAILASGFAYFFFSIFRHGGFKGAMFGARVLGQVGEVSAPRRGFMSQKLRVHVLEATDSSGPAIGIELSSRGPGAWSMTPVSLTSSDARQLVRLLEQAADGRPGVAVSDSNILLGGRGYSSARS